MVKVDYQGEQGKALVDSYSNEIDLLKKLQGNRFIIGLKNAEVGAENGASLCLKKRPWALRETHLLEESKNVSST